MKIATLFISIFFILSAHATAKIEDNIKHLNWNGIDVVFIEDNRFPTYDLVIYFADGALSDGKYERGLTSHAFNLLDSGTQKLTQKEILDQFEFYGTELSAETTHEYSTLTMSGLSKDLNTSLAQACNLLREANYPADVLKNELDKEKSEILRKLNVMKTQQRNLILKICKSENEKHILEHNYKEYKKKTENIFFCMELLIFIIYLAINFKVILF